MLKHLASLLLLALLLFLALGSSDSTSGTRSEKSPSSTSSSPSVTTGQDKQITGEHRFGCTDREYFDKLVSYAVQRTTTRLAEASRPGMVAGTCTMFKAGESVYITDTAIFSGLVEVRRKGETREYWTNLEAVK